MTHPLLFDRIDIAGWDSHVEESEDGSYTVFYSHQGEDNPRFYTVFKEEDLNPVTGHAIVLKKMIHLRYWAANVNFVELPTENCGNCPSNSSCIDDCRCTCHVINQCNHDDVADDGTCITCLREAQA